MPTRRTAAKVNTEAPKTDIVAEIDQAVTETDNTDKATETPTITLESLRAAHIAQKAQFRPSPNKGDLIAEIFGNGQIGNTAIVATKPDMGAQFVQITWDRTGISQLYPIAKIEKMGDTEWIARI